MKNEDLIFPILCPDIMDYIKGREEVCKIVLAICQKLSVSTLEVITLDTKIYTTLFFTKADIKFIIRKTSEQLLVPFTYTLLIKIENNCTVEELATLLWKFMIQATKYN